MGDFTVPARFFVLSVLKNIYAVLNILTHYKFCLKRLNHVRKEVKSASEFFYHLLTR